MVCRSCMEPNIQSETLWLCNEKSVSWTSGCSTAVITQFRTYAIIYRLSVTHLLKINREGSFPVVVFLISKPSRCRKQLYIAEFHQSCSYCCSFCRTGIWVSVSLSLWVFLFCSFVHAMIRPRLLNFVAFSFLKLLLELWETLKLERWRDD